MQFCDILKNFIKITKNPNGLVYIKFFPPKSVKKTQKNVSLIKVEVLLRMQASFLQKKNQKNIDFCHMIGCLSKI